MARKIPVFEECRCSVPWCDRSSRKGAEQDFFIIGIRQCMDTRRSASMTRQVSAFLDDPRILVPIGRVVKYAVAQQMRWVEQGQPSERLCCTGKVHTQTFKHIGTILQFAQRAS